MEIIHGQYQIQGIPVTNLAESYDTPLYVYDAVTIANQVQILKSAFSDLKVRLKYASKALTNLTILRLMKKLGCEVDAVSLEEIEIAKRAGYKPDEILFTPNSIHFSEIQNAIQMGVLVNIDNLNILELFGEKYGNTKPCMIRINPHIEAGGNDKIKTGHIESKFGISIDYLEDIVSIVEKYDIHVSGLHVHTGSDFSDVEVFMQSADILLQAAKRFKNIQIIDFGSGFKVAYKEGDKTTDVQKLANRIIQAIKSFAIEYGSEPEVWFEPGKFLVSDAGILFVKANVLKKTPATTFVGVNSGLNHLIRPMMYNAYHEIINVSNTSTDKSEYSIVGYICETDTFGWKRMLSPVKEGDILALLNAGAYGFSMSSQYNSRPRPAEVLIYEGKSFLIRRRETLSDVLQTQVDVAL